MFRRSTGLEPIRSIGSLLAEDDRSSSVEFRGEVLDALDDLDDPELAPVVLKAFPHSPPELKPRAIELLTERPSWSKAAAGRRRREADPGVGTERQPASPASEEQGPRDRRPVKAIWGTIREGRNPDRERVVAQMRRLASRRRPATPSPARPSSTSSAPSATRSTAKGRTSGPTSPSNGRNDFDQLLSNVFDPSLVIGPGYQATTVATDRRPRADRPAGRGRQGADRPEDPGRQDSRRSRATRSTRSRRATLSLMPEEIEKQLSPQEIADLFAFLCLDKPPSDPAARPLPGAGPIAAAT